MKVFCVNGISLSGKDSFVDRVIKTTEVVEVLSPVARRIHETSRKISTIDPIKEIYTDFFKWDGTKTPEHRKNLNVLKLMWIQASNGPLNWTKFKLKLFNKIGIFSVFIMVREFDEMQATIDLAKSLGYEAYSLQLVREGIPVPPVEQEFLDSHPKDYKYDITVHNPTAETFPDLPLLDIAVEAFIETYF